MERPNKVIYFGVSCFIAFVYRCNPFIVKPNLFVHFFFQFGWFFYDFFFTEVDLVYCPLEKKWISKTRENPIAGRPTLDYDAYMSSNTTEPNRLPSWCFNALV